jgi:hypothetical protein
VLEQPLAARRPMRIGFPRADRLIHRLSKSRSPCCQPPVERPGGLYLTRCIPCAQNPREPPLWLDSVKPGGTPSSTRSPGRVPKRFGPASRRSDRARQGPQRAPLSSVTSRLRVRLTPRPALAPGKGVDNYLRS